MLRVKGLVTLYFNFIFKIFMLFTKLLRLGLNSACSLHCPWTCDSLAPASQVAGFTCLAPWLTLLLLLKDPGRGTELCDTALLFACIIWVSGAVLLCLRFFFYVCTTRGSLGGIGIMGGCELPRRCWKANLGPMLEQQVLLTTEPSLQPESPELEALSLFIFRNYFVHSLCIKCFINDALRVNCTGL